MPIEYTVLAVMTLFFRFVCYVVGMAANTFLLVHFFIWPERASA